MFVKQPSIRAAPADLQVIALEQSADCRTDDQKYISWDQCFLLPWTRQIVKTAPSYQNGKQSELTTISLKLLEIAELVVES